MSTNSKIEWTEHTANLWHGCTKVTAGCDHCYAETLSKRWGRNIWGYDALRMEIKSVWNDLKKQQAQAAKEGTMARVFVGSMMDIFEKPMPLIDSKGAPVMDGDTPMTTAWLRIKLFSQILRGEYPNLIFLFLTKRPSNILKMIPPEFNGYERPECRQPVGPFNVMFGTSPCDQATFDTLVPQLLKVKGKKFLSIEPLLGPINMMNEKTHRFEHMLKYPEGSLQATERLIDWVIVGGESGHEARPMHPDWVREIWSDCDMMQTPFFFKQWGEYSPHMKDREKAVYVEYETGTVVKKERAGPNCWMVEKIGKKAAGRELDGKTYSEFPWELFEHAIPGL